MVTAKTNRKRSDTPSKPPKGPRTGRRKEFLGALILLLGVLLAVSGATYSASDDALIQGKSFWELLFPIETITINNAVGLIGAWIAYVIVPSFFGYVSLLLIMGIFLWGYLTLRKRSLQTLVVPAIHIIWIVGLLGILLGRINLHASDLGLELWAGQYGVVSAYWLNSVLGWLGSWIILGSIAVIGLLLIINPDIQHWLDHVERMGKAIRERKRNVKKEPKAKKIRKNHLQSTWENLDRKSPSSSEPPSNKDEEESAPVKDSTDQSPATLQPPQEDRDELELKVTRQITEETGRSTKPRSTKLEGGRKYKFPGFDLLDAPSETEQEIDYDELEENKTKLVEKLARYKIEIIAVNAIVGPTVTLYELTPAPGVKVSRIKSLEDDLAMVMAAQGIRMIIPIPGKSAVGVEIPNSRRELVRVQSVLNTTRFQESTMELPIVLGKTIEGEIFAEDLAKMPHLLIAGATGSGKSVGLNTMITGLLYACNPSDLKFVMVDPKKIELQQYRELEQHFLAIPEDGKEAIITEITDALDILRACEREMAIRYDLLKEAEVRGIKDYNTRFYDGDLDPDDGHKHLPYIVIIIDELADLMMTAGKDVEAPIARLAQMARAVGIHLILATQRPSVDVITGLIKANFPARVAFQVASKVDARTILDQNGAEQLVGNGDMLYMKGSKILRLQGPFVSVKEIDRLMNYIQEQPGAGAYQLPKVDDESVVRSSDSLSGNGETDELFEEAAAIIVRSQQGSVSLIQRKLSIGYTRAARIVDQLEKAGIVGAFAGGKPREVLVPDEITLEKLLRN